MRKIKFIKRLVVSFFVLVILCSTVSFYRAQGIELVSILMPAPFADSTQYLVNQFNQENRGKIRLKVIRGPLATEAMSDLAISSLLLGSAPFDGLLMDVTWLPKYAEAGWLEPLESYFNEVDISSLAAGAREGNNFNDHLYRWPLVADMGLLYWRTDLMDAPPKTPDELKAIAVFSVNAVPLYVITLLVTLLADLAMKIVSHAASNI